MEAIVLTNLRELKKKKFRRKRRFGNKDKLEGSKVDFKNFREEERNGNEVE